MPGNTTQMYSIDTFLFGSPLAIFLNSFDMQICIASAKINSVTNWKLLIIKPLHYRHKYSNKKMIFAATSLICGKTIQYIVPNTFDDYNMRQSRHLFNHQMNGTIMTTTIYINKAVNNSATPDAMISRVLLCSSSSIIVSSRKVFLYLAIPIARR